MDEKVIGYKGFDSELKCRGFQYGVGTTYKHEGTISLCARGFHFCENPLDVFSYYGVSTKNRYAKVAGLEVDKEKSSDSKRVAQSLYIEAEISLSHLIGAGVKLVFEMASSATSGDSANSATSGDSANSATSGDSAHSATSGYSAHSATSGYYAHSATSGNCSHSATSGNCSNSATSGNCANSATSGDSAHASALGSHAVAASIGTNGAAKAAIGNWIVCAEWADGVPINVKSAKVDGKKIKADTFYKLVGGKFMEVK